MKLFTLVALLMFLFVLNLYIMKESCVVWFFYHGIL